MIARDDRDYEVDESLSSREEMDQLSAVTVVGMRYHTNAGPNDYNGQTREISNWVKSFDTESKYFCVYLVLDDDNKFDVNAIKVVSPTGKTLGFVSAQEAKSVRKFLTKDKVYCAKITQVFKNTYGTYSHLKVRCFKKVDARDFIKFLSTASVEKVQSAIKDKLNSKSSNKAIQAVNIAKSKMKANIWSDMYPVGDDREIYDELCGYDERDFF